MLGPSRTFERCGKGYSFFELTERLLCHERARRPFHRICELMRKGKARTVLIHRHVERELYFAQRYEDLVQSVEDARNVTDLIEVCQVTFFTRGISSRYNHVPKNIRAEHILATCVLVTCQLREDRGHYQAGSELSYVYEAVVQFPTMVSDGERHGILNNYHHVGDDIHVVVDDREFALPAAYFVQQNGFENRCSHACLKMTMFHGPSGQSRQITTGEINAVVRRYREAAGLGNAEAFDPVNGLGHDDCLAVLREMGYRDDWCLDTVERPDVPAYEYAYLLVESGIPALLAFHPYGAAAEETGKVTVEMAGLHIMSVTGHTLNSDEWLPMAEAFYDRLFLPSADHRYVSSSKWATHLIVHDDTLGPYHCLRARDLRGHRKEGETEGAAIKYVIGLVPVDANLTMTPYVAQRAASEVFWHHWLQMKEGIVEPWKSRFSAKPFVPRTLVLRTVVIGRDVYLDHLCEEHDHLGGKASLNGPTRRTLEKTLPETFWMTEFTLPEIYSVNMSKFGEILIKADPTEEELLRFGEPSGDVICLGFRFVNNFLLADSTQFDLGFTSHYPLNVRQQIDRQY